jgi:hypothetical protein
MSIILFLLHMSKGSFVLQTWYRSLLYLPLIVDFKKRFHVIQWYNCWSFSLEARTCMEPQMVTTWSMNLNWLLYLLVLRSQSMVNQETYLLCNLQRSIKETVKPLYLWSTSIMLLALRSQTMICFLCIPSTDGINTHN